MGHSTEPLRFEHSDGILDIAETGIKFTKKILGIKQNPLHFEWTENSGFILAEQFGKKTNGVFDGPEYQLYTGNNSAEPLRLYSGSGGDEWKIITEIVNARAEKILAMENRIYRLMIKHRYETYSLSDYYIVHYSLKKPTGNSGYYTIYLKDDKSLIRLISVHSVEEYTKIIDQFRERTDAKLKEECRIDKGLLKPSEFKQVMTAILKTAP
ncbi:MAG: hypothetical protein LBR96_03450 [Treponema sp.]|jgi:hypothetical protein|nr:hypothetical protein [Treponema sp.]